MSPIFGCLMYWRIWRMHHLWTSFFWSKVVWSSYLGDPGPLRSCLSPVLPEEMAEEGPCVVPGKPAKLFQSDVQILLIWNTVKYWEHWWRTTIHLLLPVTDLVFVPEQGNGCTMTSYQPENRLKRVQPVHILYHLSSRPAGWYTPPSYNFPQMLAGGSNCRTLQGWVLLTLWRHTLEQTRKDSQ